ncbi:MAG: hypothetical protein GKR89_37685 [Candidatus Latescibacteria bacterium]|nr:hypothetical protein [Candidatus Latescibacterota bacterium]
MSRLLNRYPDIEDEHDVSKEMFLGIMMLMLCLGIMILNVAKPVWRVYQHDPQAGDVVVVYTPRGAGLSEDGHTLSKPLSEGAFQRMVNGLLATPDSDLHLILRGGSRERLVQHAARADSILSIDGQGRRVRPAVYVHAW